MKILFFKQKTAYEMRISDWSSDVCSSDLAVRAELVEAPSFCGATRKNGPSTSSGRTDEGELSFVSRVPDPLAADRRRDLRAGRDGRLHRRQCSADGPRTRAPAHNRDRDRKSDVYGKSVSVRVDLGGRRTIKKKK